MRSALICCAIVAHVASLAHSQSLEQILPASARSHDFGTVARAAKTEYRFTLHNPFKSDLHLSHVRTSCGCTTPIIETPTIPPGQTGTLLARFNTGSMIGQKAATVTITIDRPFFTELQLNVRGYIRSDVVFSPGEVNFPSIPEGEGKTTEITLNYAGRNDWAIEEIVSPFEFIKTSFEETARGGGRVQYQIKVQVDKRAPAGLLQNQLVIRTNDRRLKTVPLRLIANIESPLQVSPKEIALGKIVVGEPLQQRIVLKGRKPFRVLDINSTVADVVFKPTKDAKRAHLINITLAANSHRSSGLVQGQLSIKTDLMDAPLQIPLSYIVPPNAPQPPAEVQASNQ